MSFYAEDAAEVAFKQKQRVDLEQSQLNKAWSAYSVVNSKKHRAKEPSEDEEKKQAIRGGSLAQHKVSILADEERSGERDLTARRAFNASLQQAKALW